MSYIGLHRRSSGGRATTLEPGGLVKNGAGGDEAKQPRGRVIAKRDNPHVENTRAVRAEPGRANFTTIGKWGKNGKNSQFKNNNHQN